MHKDFTSAYGIRAIAIFELVKGFIGLAVAVTLMFLLHKDLELVAENILEYLHIDPTGHFAEMFVERASHVNESNIIIFIILAFVYTIVRLVEAYGLWRLRAWAEWFAIISGSLYVPVEVYEIFQKPTVFRVLILLANIGIVIYLYSFRREQKHDEAIHESQIAAEQN